MASAMPRANRAIKSTFRKHWWSTEAVPVIALTGGALGLAAWFTFRSAHSESVVWNKRKPEPWLNIEPGMNTKLMSVNQEFDKQYKRYHNAPK